MVGSVKSPVSDFFAAAVPAATQPEITADYPQLMKVGRMDGKQYFIPIGIYYANMFRKPMCCRGDWMKKAGVTKAPTTLDEFKDLMYKFANNDPAGDGAHTVLESFIPLEYTSIENKYGFEWAKANGCDKNIICDEKISAFPSSAKYETELNNPEDEASIAIITGKESVDCFDTFVSEWESSGGDVLTKEANDWWAIMK